MTIWLAAVALGALFAAVGYAGGPRASLVPALLRWGAFTLLAALILDAAVGGRRPVRPIVALDASVSWMRGGDATRWTEARRAAANARADTLLLVGDSVRVAAPAERPFDLASRVRPAAERALAVGRPLVLVTDGEVDDPEALAELPSGSRVIVVPGTPRADAAVSDLRAPRIAAVGDTLEVRVTVVAGAAGAAAGSLTLALDAAPLATQALDSLAPFAERSVPMRAVVPTARAGALLSAIVASRGDAVAANDTLATVLDVSSAAGAVFVSTSPDFDARDALGVLRGALSIPVRGFYRIAPGTWRADGTLTPVAEAEVRRLAREAPVVVLHGDTAALGAPRTATRGALALIAPPAASDGEWYAVGAPPSPISGALAGIAWDSLPPLDVAASLPAGEWTGLETRRARRFERRAAATGSDAGRRVVVVGASGLWRWRFRGGAAADAFTAFWGGLFDWLAAARADSRVIAPETAILRAGEPIRWRRPSAADTLVRVALTRRGDGAVDSLALRFGVGSSVAIGRPFAPGVYDVATAAGASTIVVNASREMLPRRPTAASGTIGTASTLGDPPRLRSLGWAYALLVGLLCIEWLLRRRKGMR